MPKELSHILIARKVLAQLKGSGHGMAVRAIEGNLPAFYLGAIIPDAFFYDMIPFNRFFKGYYRVSRALHSKRLSQNDARAIALFETIRTKPHAMSSKIAFAAGVVTHTVSDRIIHGVIDHYTTRLRQEGSLAMATHRALETLLDMVLLRDLRLRPRECGLRSLLNLAPPAERRLQRLYITHLAEGNIAHHGPLLMALRMAYAQQRLFLKLFANGASYDIVHLLNRLTRGKLTAWSNLFYPETIKPKHFPIMGSIDLNALTDGGSFVGTLASLIDQVTVDTTAHICRGLHKLEKGHLE